MLDPNINIPILNAWESYVRHVNKATFKYWQKLGAGLNEIQSLQLHWESANSDLVSLKMKFIVLVSSTRRLCQKKNCSIFKIMHQRSKYDKNRYTPNILPHPCSSCKNCWKIVNYNLVKFLLIPIKVDMVHI